MDSRTPREPPVQARGTTLQPGLRAAGRLGVVALVLLAACGRPSAPAVAQADAAAASAPESGEADASSPRARVTYDDDGVPLPDETRLAHGTAVPRGFEKVHASASSVTYRGKAPPEKVVQFYRRYLLCSHAEQHRRGFRFSAASPQPPGDESRTVDVLVLPLGDRASQVVIVDLSVGPRRGPAVGQEHFDEVRTKAHAGTGSATTPIPDTY